MSRRAVRRVVRTLALGALAVAFCSTASAQSRSPQTVLTVHWGNEDYPTNPVLDASIREALLSGPDAAIDYHAEYLESEIFPAEDASLALRDYIHRKYGGRRIDVVIASADASLEFVLRFRSELFPDAAVVYRGVASADPAREAGAGLTGIRTSENMAETLQLALTLHPATERVLVVAQSPSVRLQESLRAAFSAVQHPVRIDLITEESLPRLIAAITAAPSRSVVLYVRYSQQVPGHVLIPSDVAGLVADASPVPVYGVSDLYIGSGVIGGSVFRTRALGARMGQMARQILDGTRPEDIPIEPGTLVPVFDWRQLQRWGLNENRLPAGSEILFRQRGVWELYRSYILAGALLVIAQSALIAGLIVQRRRRRRVEFALRQSSEQNRDLAGRLIHAQEAERTRIARDLHDDLSQQLAGLGIMLSGLRRKIGKLGAEPDVDQAVATIQDRTSSLSQSVRNLSHELHPSVLQHAGLVATLRSHCAGIEDTHDVTVTFSARDGFDSLSSEVSLCLFRVVQEALTNAVRHARAHTIDVQLTTDEEDLALSVIDDGIGFDAGQHSTSGLGLRSIDERVRLAGGSVAVESRPGRGTTLLVHIPLSAAQAKV